MNYATDPVATAVQRTIEYIERKAVQHNSVLWFVSGGSCGQPQTAIFQGLTHETRRKLAILLVDERYGPPGHDASNYMLLHSLGFGGGELRLHDWLSPRATFSETVQRAQEQLDTALSSADWVFATLGIGQDGHTVGILPGSPAAHDTQTPFIGYQGSDFQRLTVGFSVLQRLNAAVVFAYGPQKTPALLRLRTNTESLSTLPATTLYDIPDVTIYNDTYNDEKDFIK